MPNQLNNLLAASLLDPSWRPVGGGLGILPVGEDEKGNLGWGLPGILRQPIVGAQRSLLDEAAKSSGLQSGDYLNEGTQYQPVSQPTDAFDAASLAPIAGIAAKGMTRAAPKAALEDAPLTSYPKVAGGPLQGWHASANDFESFDPSKLGTGVGLNFDGGFHFSHSPDISGPNGAWTADIARNTGQPYSYKVEIDPSAPVLDMRLPFSQQSPEVQRMLMEKADRIKTEWPTRPSQARPDNVFDDRPLFETYSSTGGYPASSLGFPVTATLDEFAVTDPSILRIIEKYGPDGKRIFSNPDKAASIPLLARALEENALYMDQAASPYARTYYHGSSSPVQFDTFNRAPWMTDVQDVANAAAYPDTSHVPAEFQYLVGNKDGAKVFPLKIDPQNPFVVDYNDGSDVIGEAFRKYGYDYSPSMDPHEAAAAKGHDFFVYENTPGDFNVKTPHQQIVPLQRNTVRSATTGDILYALAALQGGASLADLLDPQPQY